MRCKKFLIFCFLIFCIGIPFSNAAVIADSIPYVSTKFQIEATWDFPALELTDGTEKLTTFLDDTAFYFSSSTVRLDEDSRYRVRLYKLSLKNGQSEVWNLVLPDKSKANSSFGHRDTYWLHRIAVSHNKVLLFTEDCFFIYKKREGEWGLEKRVSFSDGITGYYYKDSLYVFQETDHEKYTLYRYDTVYYKVEKVLEIPFQTPFLKQFTPNRYLSVEPNAFYVLETDQPAYNCYALNGDFLYRADGKIQDWRAIDADLREKIMSYPYGVERIYQALEHNTGNSYCTQLFPFSNGEALMGYHHFDTLSQHQEFRLAFGKRESGPEWRLTPCRFALRNDEVYNDSFFPFYYYHSSVVTTDFFNDKLVQILKSAPVDYRGKSSQAYRDALNDYYKRDAPIWKIRILHLKESLMLESLSDSLNLYDIDGKRIDFQSVSKQKIVLCFSNDVQCSGCQRYLYRFLQGELETKENDTDLMVVFRQSKDYLVLREMMQKVSQELGMKFTPVFVPMGERKTNAFYEPYKYPKVLLINKRSGEYHFFDTDRLFPADMLQYGLTDDFLENFAKFLKE